MIRVANSETTFFVDPPFLLVSTSARVICHLLPWCRSVVAECAFVYTKAATLGQQVVEDYGRCVVRFLFSAGGFLRRFDDLPLVQEMNQYTRQETLCGQERAIVSRPRSFPPFLFPRSSTPQSRVILTCVPVKSRPAIEPPRLARGSSKQQQQQRNGDSHGGFHGLRDGS